MISFKILETSRVEYIPADWLAKGSEWISPVGDNGELIAAALASAYLLHGLAESLAGAFKGRRSSLCKIVCRSCRYVVIGSIYMVACLYAAEYLLLSAHSAPPIA